MSSPLNYTPLRIFREGRWQNLFIGDLTYLTDEEVNAVSWADTLKAQLEHDESWVYVGSGWMQEKRKE